MTEVILICAFCSLVVFTILWWIQLKTKNATLVDVAWSFGVGTVSAVLAFHASGAIPRRWVLVGLTTIWSLRLGGHLFFDRVLGNKKEDVRYAKLRKEWSQAKFYFLYVVQAALVILLPLTLLGAFNNSSSFPGLLDFLGLTVWIAAIAGESIADAQLAAFRKNPVNKGKTCRSGLWKYSRHPNYFFEWLIWCAYLPLAIGSPLVWVSWMGPALLLFLLLKVSGIPPTEAGSIESRGDEYREYQRTTNAFIPGRPRHD